MFSVRFRSRSFAYCSGLMFATRPLLFLSSICSGVMFSVSLLSRSFAYCSSLMFSTR